MSVCQISRVLAGIKSPSSVFAILIIFTSRCDEVENIRPITLHSDQLGVWQFFLFCMYAFAYPLVGLLYLGLHFGLMHLLVVNVHFSVFLLLAMRWRSSISEFVLKLDESKGIETSEIALLTDARIKLEASYNCMKEWSFTTKFAYPLPFCWTLWHFSDINN